MSELIFLIKSLVLAALITLALQVKVGSQTAEQMATDWLQTSSASLYLQEVSAGGVLFIQNSYETVKNYINNKSNTNGQTTERASRLKFELKRNSND